MNKQDALQLIQDVSLSVQNPAQEARLQELRNIIDKIPDVQWQMAVQHADDGEAA